MTSPNPNQTARTSPADKLKPARLIVVMGVAGSGKSTFGAALAEALNVPFLDGDRFHAPAAIEKMRQGTPLTDADRWPWLGLIAAAMQENIRHHARVVTACSALKRAYRDHLIAAAGEPIIFLHLTGDWQAIAERLKTRSGHFMPATLLESQFAALEPLAGDENGLTLDTGKPLAELIAQSRAALGG